METLYGLFTQQVYKNPDKVAVISNNIKTSYFELKRKVDCISKAIYKLGLKDEGILVAIPRTTELIASLLAVSHTNNYYIPLDLSYPEERIKYIINNSKAQFVICKKNNGLLLKESNCIFIEDIDFNTCQENIVVSNNDTEHDRVSYCLYTSGSTGNPKGVLIKESALLNFISGMEEVINFQEVSTMACLTTQCFDIFFLESIMALCVGLTVILSSDTDGNNPSKIGSLLLKYQVDIIQMTPSRVKLIMEFDKNLESFRELKTILIGGENFPLPLLYDLQRLTSARIYNLYGPTETTIWSAVCDLTAREKISLGNPIRNTEFYITDENNHKKEIGIPGELCIGGAGLAEGYLNEIELTNEKFINLNQVYVYKTGDYVVQDVINGEYKYLGRLDNQVKINGHRIELEEIEIAANQLDGMSQCLAVVEGNHDLDFLTLYYLADKNIDGQAIRLHLSKYVPDYMIPNKYKKVRDFHYTSNGKINRKQLPEYQEICDGTEEGKNDSVFFIISDVLKNIVNTEIKKSDGFKEIGLNSIAFIKLLTELEDIFKIEFDEDNLSIDKYNTVSSLIDTIITLRGRNVFFDDNPIKRH